MYTCACTLKKVNYSFVMRIFAFSIHWDIVSAKKNPKKQERLMPTEAHLGPSKLFFEIRYNEILEIVIEF